MLGTANIQNLPDMRPKLVAADARTIMANTTVAGLQEIQPEEDTDVILHQLGDGWGMKGRARETPVIYNRRLWESLDHRVIPFHRPRLPHPESVNGAVVSVVLKARDRPALPPFAVLNTHLVSGGYNGDRLDVIADRWRVEWGIVRDEAFRLWKRGLTVFVVGDLNAPRPPKLQPLNSFQWLSPATGTPDHLGELRHPESVYIRHPRHQVVPLHSDHDLHVISGPLRHAGWS